MAPLYFLTYDEVAAARVGSDEQSCPEVFFGLFVHPGKKDRATLGIARFNYTRRLLALLLSHN